jgi:hypothetical protein
MLNEQQQGLLKAIMIDKFSNGAFCGMVFNAYIQNMLNNGTTDIEGLIATALNVRLKAMELSGLK